MTNCHKPVKDDMTKWSEQTAQESTHHCYHNLKDLHITMDFMCIIKLKYERLKVRFRTNTVGLKTKK